MNTEEIEQMNEYLRTIGLALIEIDKSLKQISKEIKNKKIDSGVI